MTRDEILGKLSEMENLDESDGSLDEIPREILLARLNYLAFIQEHSQTVENDSINWVMVSIITIALFSFAIMMTILIIHLQRKPSHNSETASQVNA